MFVARVAALLCLATAVFAAGGGSGSAQPARTVVVAFAGPRELAGNYVGRLPVVSPRLPERGTSEMEVVIAAPPTSSSCGAIPKAVPAADFIVMFRENNCTVAEQVLAAEKVGAKGVILVSSSQTIDTLWSNQTASGPLGIIVVGTQKSLGDEAASWAKASAHPEGLRVSIVNYTPSGPYDVSQVLLVCLATSLVVAGAFFSTADLRLGSPIAPKRYEVVEMDHRVPCVFFGAGSLALVVLYFTMKYLIYAIIFLFCLGGTTTLAELFHKCLRYRFPALQRRVCSIPCLGAVEVAALISLPAAVSVSVFWFVLRNTRHGWLCQDIIGAAFLCFLQRTMRLPSMKLATFLLSLMFCFDIFWVFLSPLIFEHSVMVVVATGGGTGESVPMLLRLPAIGDALGRDRMLGFGDIALPGLLVSFLRRHDLLSGRSLTQGYFAPAVLGYFLAMFATLFALYVMQMGQPALLYLVPGTLGTTLLLAWRRGHLRDLWEGRPSALPAGARLAAARCNYCPGGHELTPWAAEAGTCDGCNRGVAAGEQVMDCRTCNWYLCGQCRPLDVPGPAAGIDLQDAEDSLVNP